MTNVWSLRPVPCKPLLTSASCSSVPVPPLGGGYFLLVERSSVNSQLFLKNSLTCQDRKKKEEEEEGAGKDGVKERERER